MEPCKSFKRRRCTISRKILKFCAECKQHTYNWHLALFLRGEIAKEKGSLGAGYVEINLSPPTTRPALSHGSAVQREPRRMALRMWKRKGGASLHKRSTEAEEVYRGSLTLLQNLHKKRLHGTIFPSNKPKGSGAPLRAAAPENPASIWNGDGMVSAGSGTRQTEPAVPSQLTVLLSYPA